MVYTNNEGESPAHSGAAMKPSKGFHLHSASPVLNRCQCGEMPGH